MIWVHRPVGDGQVLCVRPGSLWAFVLAPLPLEGVQGGADGQGGASVVGLVGESCPSTPFSLRIIPGERGLGCLWWQQTRAMEKSGWGVRSVASKPCFGRCTSWHVGRPLCSSLASVSPSVNRGLDWLADLLAVVVVGGLSGPCGCRVSCTPRGSLSSVTCTLRAPPKGAGSSNFLN